MTNYYFEKTKKIQVQIQLISEQIDTINIQMGKNYLKYSSKKVTQEKYNYIKKTLHKTGQILHKELADLLEK